MGFYTPSSMTKDYVTNQRTEQGGFKWDQMMQKVGMQQQSALYNLNTQYAKTINTAYSSYLLANRGIAGSTMGQGYKEAYQNMMQEGLQSDIAQANLSMANIRGQLAQEGAGALGNIEQARELEIANLNRVGDNAKLYLDYLKEVRQEGALDVGYLTEEQQALTMDDKEVYEVIFNAQPRGFTDDRGNEALSYLEWLNNNMKDNEADRLWYNWLNAGGFNQFREAASKGIKK